MKENLKDQHTLRIIKCGFTRNYFVRETKFVLSNFFYFSLVFYTNVSLSSLPPFTNIGKLLKVMRLV